MTAHPKSTAFRPSSPARRPGRKPAAKPTAGPAGAAALKDASLLCELGAFHLLHGRAEDAAHMARAALWLHPKSGRAQRLLAHSLARGGRPLEAVKALIEAGRAPDVNLGLGDWGAIGTAMLALGHRDLGLKFLFKRD